MSKNLTRVAQIVIGVLMLTGLLLTGLGALLPRRWHVEESVMINAPPTAIHAWVNDLEHWPEWAQWNQTDLGPKNQVSGPSAGTGARLTWYGRGGGEPTSGEVRIVRSDPALGVWFEIVRAAASPRKPRSRTCPDPASPRSSGATRGSCRRLSVACSSISSRSAWANTWRRAWNA